MRVSLSPRRVGFSVFEVDLQDAEVRKRGLQVKLQHQPFQILATLLEQPGELITRDELRRKLWPADTFVDFDRSLNKAMNKLRLALGDSAKAPRFIETLPGRGYRFIAPITAQCNDATGVSAAAHGSAVNREVVLEELEKQPTPLNARLRLRDLPSQLWLRRFSIVGVAALILTCSALIYYVYPRPLRRGPSPSAGPRRSVAVLGFKNLSGRPEEAWLSTALSDWLTTELAAGEQLRTIPEENVARMKIELSVPEVESLSSGSLARIRKNLGTDLVVVGSYASLGKESGELIRLDLRLQDTQNGETIEAISETGTESDLLDLVSRAGVQLRAKLGIQGVTPEETVEVAGALPANPDAARLYSEGLGKLRVFDAPAAREPLQKAASEEPGFALSHSALATAWAALGYDEKAKEEARRAFELSQHLGREAHLLVEGRYCEISGNWQGAVEVYQALFRFFPDNLDYGLALAKAEESEGRGRDALETVEELRQLRSPVRDDARIDLAETRAAESLGDFKRVQASAARAAEKAQAMGASVLLAQALGDQAWAFVNVGEPDRAMAMATEAENLSHATGDRKGVARAVTLKAIVLERQGDSVGAMRMYEEALAIYRQTGNKYGVATELLNIGIALRELGDLTRARGKLDESLQAYQEIRHRDGVANTMASLGWVLLGVGDPGGAKKLFGQSLEICREIGDRSKAAQALAGLGDLLRVEGKLEEARKYDDQALAVFEEIGNKRAAAERRLAIADLMNEQGKWAEAAAAARSLAKEFEREKTADDGVVAYVVMARSLLAQRKIIEAREAIERATVLLDKGQNRDAALSLAVSGARVHAALGDSASRSLAVKELRDALAEATTAGFVGPQFEARLALSEIEMNAGNTSKGRADLEVLQKDADQRGFGLIARKARAALGIRARVLW